MSSSGIECTVAAVSSFNPGPTNHLVELLTRFPLVYTLEAHFINGGVGSYVSEIIAENRNITSQLTRLGIKTVPDGMSGSQEFLYKKFGISGDVLVNLVLSKLKK